MRMLTLALCFLGLCLTAAPVRAQDAGHNDDLQKRIEIARKIHQARPLDAQIENAVKQLSLRYPPDKRDLFVSKMMQVFDEQALTDISVQAMAETFTAGELEKMYDYNTSPEGKSASEKMPIYQSLIQPELMKKIDQALMEIRTGKPGE